MASVGITRTQFLPVALLLFFAATFPEVLSGSTPVPVLLTHPLGYAMLFGLYGCGAVLVWEALARWKKGWLAVLPLGGAYGIAEEGLGTKVFTDPHQQRVITGTAGSYGNWLGIEWVSFVGIDIFHAVISMGLGLLLVALLFPTLKGRSIVSNRGLVVVGIVFVAVVTLMFFTVDTDPLLPLAGALAFVSVVAVAFILLGRNLPERRIATWMRSPLPTARPRAFFLIAFGWLLPLLALFQIGVHLLPWPIVIIAVFLVSAVGSLAFLVTRAGWRENRPHQVAFLGGLAAAFVVWGVVVELFGDIGVLAFSALLVGIVVWLWRHPNGLVAGSIPGPTAVRR
jgi:hypothetical protein